MYAGTPMRLGSVALIAFAFLGGLAPARAEDVLKLALADSNAWESQPAVAGRDDGAFRKASIALTANAAHGGADALQAVLSGAADVAVGVDTAIALRAFANGASVRVLLPLFTGTSDLYWYAKADSPIATPADTTDNTTIAYSTTGSLTHAIATEFARGLKLKGKPVMTGSPGATLIAVMSGTVDIGWARAPFGLKEVAEGRTRIVLQGSEVTQLRSRTLRVMVVAAETLQKKKEALSRFVKAWRDTVASMAGQPAAAKNYAQAIHLPEDIVAAAIGKSFPQSAMQTDVVSGLDETMRDLVAQKVLAAPLTREQIAEFVAVPPR